MGLIACMQAGQVKQMMLILDGDEEVYRLGYCDVQSLEKSFEAAQQFNVLLMRRQGLRIGLLMTHDNVLVWTPTPLMFEAPRQHAEPNGMVLTPETFQELPLATGVDPGRPIAPAEIGTVALNVDEVIKVVAAIKVNRSTADKSVENALCLRRSPICGSPGKVASARTYLL